MSSSSLPCASVSLSSSGGVHEGKWIISDGRMVCRCWSLPITAFAECPLNANAVDGSRRAARDQDSHSRANSSRTVHFDCRCREASSFCTTCATQTRAWLEAMRCNVARTARITCWKSCVTLSSAECFARLHGCSDSCFDASDGSQAAAPTGCSTPDAMSVLAAKIGAVDSSESLTSLRETRAGSRYFGCPEAGKDGKVRI